MGLKKLLSEFSGEIQRLEAEIARLHGELAISETKLQAEKQNAANDREALARARHDLERHRLDDASAAKMVSRYMCVLHSPIHQNRVSIFPGAYCTNNVSTFWVKDQ